MAGTCNSATKLQWVDYYSTFKKNRNSRSDSFIASLLLALLSPFSLLAKIQRIYKQNNC